MKYIKFTLTRPVPDKTCDKCCYYEHQEFISAFTGKSCRDACILFDELLDGNKRCDSCIDAEIKK